MPQYSSFKYLGLAVLGSAFWVALPSYSQAQEPAAQFRPIKAWEVGAKGTTAQSRECVIQNEFNNGFLVQFNGSSNWVQSLNVNFRQNVFEAGKSYKAIVSVPGKSPVDVQANGVKANIVSVPIKTQKELFKDIRSAAVMDLDVEGNAFRFFMTGFGDAAIEFEKCMAGQQVVAETSMVKAAVPAPSQEEETFVLRLSDEEKAQIEAANADTPAALINESIAFEQEEAGRVAVQEVIPPLPTPVTRNDVGTSEAQPPLAQLPKGNQSHRRLSDQLAAQLAENPDLAAIDPPAPEFPSQPLEGSPAVVREAEFEGAEAVVERPDAKPEGLDIPEKIVAKAPETIEQDAPVSITPIAEAAAEPDIIVEVSEEPFEEITKDKVISDVTEMAKPAPSITTLPNNVKIPDDAPESVKRLYAQQSQESVAVEPMTAPEPEAEPIVIDMDTPKEEEIVVEMAPAEPEEAVMPMPELPELEERDIKMTKSIARGEADFTGLPSREIDPIKASADMARLAVLEQKIAALQAENVALSDELNVSLREGEQERLSIANENWNLERATMLYNEAERQNKKLGMQLQKERAQHALEKKELEALLFDPEVTSQEQLARLSQLERELAAAKARLRELEGL